jgi:hypothetical protein
MIKDIHRSTEDSKRTLALLRRGLLRLGSVQSVDDDAGTLVVEYPEEDATGQPLRSYPMPWLQSSTSHRPPLVGDHVLVLDPSLGNGGALALPGWPSEARPPVEGGGPGHVLYSGDQSALIKSDSTQIMATPDDVTITADEVVMASDAVKIGSASATEAIPLGTALNNKLTQILTYLTALNAVLTGPPIAEPGNGAPSALKTALGLAVATTPLPADMSGTLSTKHTVD